MADDVVVRRAQPEDESDWVRLRTALWPEWPDDHPTEVRAHLTGSPDREVCFVAEVDGRLVGFAELRLREYAEECETSPVGYLEGIFVDPTARVRGVGRALVSAGEAWARDLGCTEMASDRDITNEESGAFHLAVGFDEAVRLVAYRKDL
ncbi:MAG: aminoglycoside 6'-N-acetyltransferase [Gemmatimonadota bacterium]